MITAVVSQTRPSVAYQFGLSAVAVAMGILPCIYIALTGLVGYGVYYFATQFLPAILRWPSYSYYMPLAKVVCGGTPLLVGSVITAFMVKPLFSARGRRMQPLALNPQIEPRVYELVQTVCEAVGAPSPHRIELNCDLNASAHFDRGLLGFVRNRLILTLGLPLVAGLTERELAGVIAHEFGHFRQGAGMRLSYLIN